MEQHLAALKKANHVRVARATVCRKLKRGEIKLAQALAEDAVEGMRLYDLLRYIPVNGPSKVAHPTGGAHETAKQLLRHCEATATTTVLGLGPRRLKLLLDEVEKRWGGRV